MSVQLLWEPIVLPLAAGVLALLFRRRQSQIGAWFCVAVTAVHLAITARLFGQEANLTVAWAAYGWQFALRLYHFSGFILLASAAFAFLIALYSTAFMKQRRYLNQYYAYLLFTLGQVNGAVLADNLILMLFFWESLLLTLFGMIIIGRPGAFKTAIKAFIIAGSADLCLLLGVGLTIYLAGTMNMSQIHLPVGAWGSLAFILLMIGAIAKAGAMPFHSWIPDAAIDAPLPFMALLPAALEKLLGIYFLARISLDLFALNPLSWLSPLLMILGSITILLAVMMALAQGDYKRLLSFHAISQVGYMILGIGTAVPAGVIGGLFHMLNHAMYKSCLFLTGGAVERQAGTTELAKLGGLRAQMPLTFLCFIVAAVSISGAPPCNGFFSKELIYDGALEAGRIWRVGWVFYGAALLGSFFTAASFLKLGHAAFGGKAANPQARVQEAPAVMLIPMIIIAAFCLLFGIWNALPINHLIQPILTQLPTAGHQFAGWPTSMTLVLLTLLVLAGALWNHFWGAKRTGQGQAALDHILLAPGLRSLYAQAEQRRFDPYEIGLKIAHLTGQLAGRVDRGIDFIYDTAAVKITYALTRAIRRAHNGSLVAYLSWSLAGLLIIIALILGGY